MRQQNRRWLWNVKGQRKNANGRKTNVKGQRMSANGPGMNVSELRMSATVCWQK